MPAAAGLIHSRAFPGLPLSVAPLLAGQLLVQFYLPLSEIVERADFKHGK